MFKFSGQPLDRAVVPLLTGPVGNWEPPFLEEYYKEDGTLASRWESRKRVDGRSLSYQWNVLWGIFGYMYGGVQHVAEVYGLMQPYMHDFCGGGLGSSYSIKIRAKSTWTAQDILSLRGPRHVATWTPENWEALPRLEEALLPNTDLQRDNVYKVMARSLMFSTVGQMLNSKRRGLACFDRMKEGSTRPIWEYGPSITRVLWSTLFYGGNEFYEPLEQATRPMDERFDFGSNVPKRTSTQPVQARFEHGNPFVNVNSARTCSLMSLTVIGESPDSFPRDDIHTEENCVDLAANVELPDWWYEKVRLQGYLRLFPRMFCGAA